MRPKFNEQKYPHFARFANNPELCSDEDLEAICKNPWLFIEQLLAANADVAANLDICLTSTKEQFKEVGRAAALLNAQIAKVSVHGIAAGISANPPSEVPAIILQFRDIKEQ